MSDIDFEIRVAESVPSDAPLVGLDITPVAASTQLSGRVSGPAELLELLVRLRDLQLTVLSVWQHPASRAAS